MTSRLLQLHAKSDLIDRATLCRWMRVVIDHCRRGVAQGQNPFAAAVYAADGKQLSLEFNEVRRTGRPSHHAEVMAIDKACLAIGGFELRDGDWLVTSGEPCPMCAATAASVGIRHIAFGAAKETIEIAGYGKLGSGCEKIFPFFGREANIIGGIEEDDCAKLLVENPAPRSPSPKRSERG